MTKQRRASLPEAVRSLISQAIRAPSSHNTQPWIFRATGDRVELFADRTRALPVNDPYDRELTISCGCALMNLRVAAAADGYAASVDEFPDEGDDDLLARLHLGAPGGGDPELAGLAPAIGDRRTFRKRFTRKSIPREVVAELIASAHAEGAWLDVHTGEDIRRHVAKLIAEGDQLLWSNPSWRRELAAWMHPRRRDDGLAVPGLVAPVAQAVVRTFDMGNGVGARDSELVEESPVIAVLGTDRDDPSAWLAAGQALGRVLLTACTHGVQASYLNQPLQVPELRAALETLLGHDGFPQTVMRLGFPDEETPLTSRRPVGDVVEAD